MDAFQLADWFKWKSMDTPLHYINQTLAGMAENMGIKTIPEGRKGTVEVHPSPKPKVERKETEQEEESPIDIFAMLGTQTEE